MTLDYTLPKFTDDDEMYFEEEDKAEPDEEMTIPLYDDDDELYGVAIKYRE